MQKDRKIEHKKIVKNMRKRNKSLADDEYLGLNRFRMDIYSEDWRRFSDGSGGILTIAIKFTDKWTGNKAIKWFDNYDFWWDVFRYLNDFVIRCMDGHTGHFPRLNYDAYDIHQIMDSKGNVINQEEEYIVNSYNWTNFKNF